MLKILIVDDEPLARARLTQLLGDAAAQVPLAIAGEADGGRTALAAADRLAPDIVLLDIQMPDMAGIEVARHLAARERPPAVIFVTAYDEHALEAFEVQALDYLLKPVRLERLVAALQRAQRLRPHDPKLQEVARSLRAARTHLTVSERGKMILVPVDEIVYLRAELKYVTIRTAAREYLTEESLSSLEAEFGERFVRIHRNALVARKSIHGFQRVKGGAGGGEAGDGHWEVLLKELPERLPISRRQWPTVKAAARPGTSAAVDP
jgi:two-component system response regulator AlgR